MNYECEACGRPIKDGKGYLVIRVAEVDDYMEVVRIWKRQYQRMGPDKCGPMPAKPCWLVTHTVCAAKGLLKSSGVVVVAVREVRTVRGLLKTTTVLMEQYPWLALTDWLDRLRDVAYP